MTTNKMNDPPRIMVFRPTMEEFSHFSEYIEYMESQGAHRAGVAKIIPPKEWKPRKAGYDDIEDLVIPAPITQEVQGRQGLYQQYNIQKKSITVKDYRKMAESEKFQTPVHFDYEELERKYWKNITYISPMYGADVSGSLYDEDVDEFNINRLNSCLDLIGEDYKIKIEGVNTAYLYFGMWKTSFAWHTEDMDLYSINYVHFGAPKSWYAIPPEHGKRLERLASGFFPSSSQICSAFLRHKMTIISPQILKQYSIPFNKITQEPGEFMITFPYGYHSGYNHGFNCAESTNFAIPRWIEYGKRCLQCTCRNDSVKISMESFVKKYQPERYELWLQGKDIGSHPEDPTRVFAANPPNRMKNLKFSRQMGKPEARPKRHPAHIKIQKGELKSETSIDPTSKHDSVKVEPNTYEETDEKNMDYTIIKEEPLVMDDKQQLVTKRKIVVEEQSVLKKQKPATETNLKASSTKGTKARKPKKTETANNVSDESVNNIFNLLTDFRDKHAVLNSPHLSISVVKNGQTTSGTTVNNTQLTSSVIRSPVPVPVSIVPACASYILPDDNPAVDNIQTVVAAASSLLQLSQQPVESVLPDVISDHKYSSPVPIAIKSLCTDSEVVPSIVKSTPVTNLSSNCDMESRDSCVGHSILPNNVLPAPLDKRHAKNGLNSTIIAKQPYQDDMEELHAWQHVVRNLWHDKPLNFQAEKEFNKWCSLVKPHCAVCMLFKPFADVASRKEVQPVVPEQSEVEVPMPYFEQMSLQDNEKTRDLLICTECNTCVHNCCYGQSKVSLPWKCDRCSANETQAECSLCNLRGGPMKPSTNGKWVHITCALILPDVKFKDSMKYIDCTNIVSARQILKCMFCQNKTTKTSKMACTQCSVGRCLLSFHVTCGYVAGVIYEKCNWPDPIKVLCLKHCGTSRQPKLPERKLLPVREGSTVIAKHKNSRYYCCEILEITAQTFYSVTFEDGTFSEDLFPEDIVSHDCVKYGPPKRGAKVSVQWTDGNIYSGIFKESSAYVMCTVEFEDGSVNKVRRVNVYAEGEELPKKVTSKLSMATERKHMDVFDHNNKAKGKRVRHLNMKYSSECILPSNTFPFINN